MRPAFALALVALGPTLAACLGADDGPAGARHVVAGRGLGQPAFADDAHVIYTVGRDLWIVRSEDRAADLVAAGLASPGVAVAAPFSRGRHVFARRADDGSGVDPLVVHRIDVGAIGDHGFERLPATAIRADGEEVAGILGSPPGGEPRGLYAGAPDAISRVAGEPFDIRQIEFMDQDLVALADLSGRDGIGLHRFDAASRRPSLLVAPSHASPEAQSSKLDLTCPFGTLDSCRPFRIVGCTPATSFCPGTATRPCAIAYGRTLLDGTRRPFVYDLNRAAELPLPGTGPLGELHPSPDGHALAWAEPDDAGTGLQRIRHWEACTGESFRCSLPGSGPPSPLWRSNGQGFGVVLPTSGQLGIVTRSPNRSCFLPGTATSVTTFTFSPDASRIAWLGASGSTPALWVASADGTGGRMLAVGGFVPILAFSTDGRWVFVSRQGDQSLSLSAFDLDAADAQEQVIAETYGTVRYGAARMLLTADWNAQERTGDLVLVDLASGLRRTIDRTVAAFEVRGDIDGAAQVAYVVRTRYPSGRDGMWLSTLAP